VQAEPTDSEPDSGPTDREPGSEPTDSEPDSVPTAAAQPNHGPMFSGFGIVSTLLGLVCIAAVVLSALIWKSHREHADNLSYQIRVAQAAVDWTGVLINMNKDNVDTSLQKLHDGTVGELNNDFDAAMKPYRDVVLALQSRTSGQINSVSMESLHHNLAAQPGAPAPSTPAPPELASRTDTVLIVATSVSENAGGPKPQTVRWNLRLGVSDVDGKLLISRLEPIR
jgi:hypothetical protein